MDHFRVKEIFMVYGDELRQPQSTSRFGKEMWVYPPSVGVEMLSLYIVKRLVCMIS